MIHWDWVLTATVAAPCVLIALALAARIGGAIEDAFDVWSTRRAIEAQKREQDARADRYMAIRWSQSAAPASSDRQRCLKPSPDCRTLCGFDDAGHVGTCAWHT